MKHLESFDNHIDIEYLGDIIVYRLFIDIVELYTHSKIDTTISRYEVRYGFRNKEYEGNNFDWDSEYHAFSVSIIKDYIIKNTITIIIDFDINVFTKEHIMIKENIKNIYDLLLDYNLKLSDKSYPDPYVVKQITRINLDELTTYRYNLMFEYKH